MNAGESTQLLPALLWREPLVQRLNHTWLLAIGAVVLAIAVPWFLSGLAVDLPAAGAGVVVLGAIHLGFSVLSGAAAPRQSRSTGVLVALHALGVLTLAFIWHHAGGLQNPLFLTVFTLPVLGAIFLSRRQPYFIAALAVAAVALVAWGEAPELRWYAPRLGAAGAYLEALLGTATANARAPFSGFYAPAEYFVVLLEAFAVVMAACAVAAEYLGTLFDRLDVQVRASRTEAVRSQALWSTLLEQLPLPAVLLDAGTHEVISASAPAVAKFFADHEGAIEGCDFFQAVHFTYPEPIQQLVNGVDGVEQLSMVRLGDRLLATEVRVQHVSQQGRRLALVLVNDTMETLCVRAALDASEHAALVADPQGRILALNKPARALFAAARVGADVSHLVPHPDAEVPWWDPGLSGRRKMHLTVMRRLYQVTSSAVALPGEDARLHVITFLPAARVTASDPSVTGATRLMQRE